MEMEEETDEGQTVLPTVGLEWSPATQQNPYSHCCSPSLGPQPLALSSGKITLNKPLLQGSVSSVLDCDLGSSVPGSPVCLGTVLKLRSPPSCAPH